MRPFTEVIPVSAAGKSRGLFDIVGTGIENASAMSCQPFSFREQICPEVTRP